MIPENSARRKPKGPFANTAKRYRAAGFLGTIPLPPGQKEPPPANFTGGGKPYPTAEQVNQWRRDQSGGNIGLRLAEVPSEFLSERDDLLVIYAGNNVDGWELIGIDVDNYTKGSGPPKTGAAELSDLETQLGELPATALSGARFDTGSCIAVYLVPKGYRFAGKVAESIEVVQKRHRYMAVHPSTHPDARDADGQPAIYQWRRGAPSKLAEAGVDVVERFDGDLPAIGDVAMLPEAWFVHLTHGGMLESDDPISDLSPSQLVEWIENRPLFGAEPCAVMSNAVTAHLAKIADSPSSHDRLIPAHWQLLSLAAEGHAGVQWALAEVERAWWEHASDKRAPEVLSTERERSLLGALGKIQPRYQMDNGGDYAPDDTCAAAGRFDCDAWADRLAMSDAAPATDEDDPPSWRPVDVGKARRGVGATPPTILTRSDGACLFYRGKVHSVHGESESGKSWLVQCAAVECLLRGEPVLYIDFEDEAGAVADRLVRLGVPSAIVDDPAMFAYLHPEAPPSTDRERAAFEALLDGTYSLAVIDGVTDSMGLFGLSGKDADDVAKWHRVLPKAVARHTGAAVVCVDHVAKDANTRGRFALGSQHKIAGLSGAAYVVEMEHPFAVGQAGRASVRVGKDRPGRVRGLGGRWRKSDRTQHIADLHLDSTDSESSTWVLELPRGAGSSTDVDEATTGTPGKVFRPTWFMEQVSRYWEEADDPAERTNNKTVNAMCAERKEQGKTQYRQRWRDAIKFLVDEGFAKAEPGARESEIHVVVKPYRQLDDPLCDEYSPAASGGVEGWKHRIHPPVDGGEDGESGVKS